MFNEFIGNTPSFDLKRTRAIRHMLQDLPAVLALNVLREATLLQMLEEECGLTYDSAGMFAKLVELLADEHQAMNRVSGYVHYHTYGRLGLGACQDTIEYLKVFSWMAQLLYQQFKREGIYRGGVLSYNLDHMRGTSMILRRSDLIYELIRHEFGRFDRHHS